ncbi:50S ribosomal protein L3 N(5)-glutamine methyltransferase [Candidatus Legionella polyplacis]|uniref:50S ribosomal protein L3 N(5)-glutamine methyltransferase n=1 Tax=Candidatus Legionella polyplacis TaxID=2005262 RepID=A0ABZ2GZV8_9GAMM
MPVSYLIKRSYFYGLLFYVDRNVFIPRSPMVSLFYRKFLPWVKTLKVKSILDLCTGSGCLAISCCYIFSKSIIDAVDISEKALEIAKINCKKHRLCDRINFIRSDLWCNVPKIKYDLIISNPPYVGKNQMSILPMEYRYEPKIALECIDDGFYIIKKILVNAYKYLSKNGMLFIEIGDKYRKLINTFPKISFINVNLELGGTGVLLFTKKDLVKIFNCKI